MKFNIGDTVEIIKGKHRYMIGTVINYIYNPPLYVTSPNEYDYNKRDPLYVILPKTDIGLDGYEYKHNPLYFGEDYLKLFNNPLKKMLLNANYGLKPGGNYENFWSNGAYHLYSDKKYEPNVVYLKRDEQVVKDIIKNLMEENNMEFNFKDGDIVELSHGVIGVVKGIGDLNGQYLVQLAGCSGMYKYYGSSLTLIKRGTVKYINKPEVKKVIFSGNCTIVLFTDDTKVIVRAEGEEFDKEKGLAMALAKRAYGTNEHFSNYYDIFKKWIPEEKTMEDISIEITDAIMNGSSKKKISKLIKESIDIIDSKKDNNPCIDCPDRKTGCLTNCKKMQDYADECYNNTKKIEDDRVKEIEKKFGEKVRAMREKNKSEKVKKGFIGDFYFKKDYHAQMFPKEFLQFCIDNDLVFYLDDGKDTMVDPSEVTYLKVTGYLNKTHLPVTMKQKYVCSTKFHGWRPSIAVDVNYVVFSKRPR